MEAATAKEPLDLDRVNEQLLRLPAEERIQWAAAQFGEAMVMLSSMQKTASVLVHMFYRLGLDNEILFSDTGFHFHETLRLRDDFMRKYRVNLVTVYPDQTPEEQEQRFSRKLHLFVDGQPECCRLRKEEPFLRHMHQQGRRVVVSGLRSVEGGKRGRLQPIMRDPRIAGYTVHPILEWTDEEVEQYLAEHEVLVHPLHAQNFPSIGCACCTTPVEPGEDPRAGRWRHLRQPDEQGPRYCGINFTDGSGI